MRLSRHIRNAARELLKRYGYVTYRRPFLPKGADAFDCIRAHWPHWRPGLIFDVGANTGQTYERLRPVFPTARIVCFEPVPASFAILQQLLATDTLSEAIPLALSNVAGTAWIHAHQSSDQSSMSPGILQTSPAHERIEIQTETLAAICARKSVSHIDLLKIDVEGFEPAVLAGATPLLEARAVDFIVIEAGLVPGNPRFTPLPLLTEQLISQGYWLIAVCEQYGIRFSQGAEFCNAVFCLRSRLEASNS